MRNSAPIPDIREVIRETLQEHQRSNQATMQEHQRSNQATMEQHQATMAQQYEVLGERFHRMSEAITTAAEASAAGVGHLREALDAKMQEMEMRATKRDEKVEELESRLGRQERISAELDKRMGQIEDPHKRAARRREEKEEKERTVAALVAHAHLKGHARDFFGWKVSREQKEREG